jgi:hypothetical protein
VAGFETELGTFVSISANVHRAAARRPDDSGDGSVRADLPLSTEQLPEALAIGVGIPAPRPRTAVCDMAECWIAPLPTRAAFR